MPAACVPLGEEIGRLLIESGGSDSPPPCRRIINAFLFLSEETAVAPLSTLALAGCLSDLHINLATIDAWQLSVASMPEFGLAPNLMVAIRAVLQRWLQGRQPDVREAAPNQS